MLIDTHCHLKDNRYDDIDLVIKRAKKNGINNLIVIGCDLEEMKFSKKISEKYENIYFTLGEHPIYAKKATQKSFRYIEDNINHPKCVGIGECGLDYYWKDSTKEEQNVVFRKQIDLAIKYDKPLSIHTRDSIKDTYDILKEFKGELRGVIHCFSGSVEMMKKFLDLGFYIGLGGVVTFKNSKGVKEVAKQVDINKLVLETDSPYLAPEPFRGKLNEPKNILNIAEYISNLRGISLEELAIKTTNNAKKLFNIK